MKFKITFEMRFLAALFTLLSSLSAQYILNYYIQHILQFWNSKNWGYPLWINNIEYTIQPFLTILEAIGIVMIIYVIIKGVIDVIQDKKCHQCYCYIEHEQRAKRNPKH